MRFGSNHIQCSCIELGCANELFERDGATYPGRLFHRTNYARHQAKIKKAIPQPQPALNFDNTSISPPLTSNTKEASGSSQNPVDFLTQILPENPAQQPTSTDRLTVSNTQSTSQKRGRDSFESDLDLTHSRLKKPAPNRSGTSSISVPILSFSTAAFKIPQTFVQQISTTQSLLHVINDYLNHRKSEKSCRSALAMERLKVQTALNSDNLEDKSETFKIWTEIPRTIQKALKCFHLVVLPFELVCCPICFTMHGQNTMPVSQARCNHLRFPSKTSTKPRIVCNTKLYKPVITSTTTKFIPRRLFYHQSLIEWLARMLSFPAFEKALEASLSAQPQLNQRTTDIWDGSMWKLFKLHGKIYTKTLGNLVFGFFCDWFNPYGKNSARSISAGILSMICFNLPPDIRYRTQNMFIFGITPGPREPDSYQLQPCIAPLIDELKTLSNGVHFTQTSLHPHGRPIRVVVWPLIADVPAMKKVSGFSSHSSTNFCSICYITSEDINVVDHRHFKLRNSRSHKSELQKWLIAPNAKKRKEALKEDGVRYTIFSELPYWHPIHFPTIDIMHCLVLGLLRDLSTTYLQIGIAGKRLQTECENRDMRGEYSDDPIPHNPVGASAPQSESSLNFEPANRSDQSSSVHQTSSDRSHYPRSAKSKTSTIGSHEPYEPSTNPPKSEGSEETITEPPFGPSLTPHELEIVHKCIKTTCVPSWLTRVPHQIGMARCGTPKAAEWLTLYSIYMVFSLIPHFHNSEPNSTSSKMHKAILLATQIINIGFSRALYEEDLEAYSKFLLDYRKHLRAEWPAIQSKPNLHFAQHLPEQVRRYGPPSYTASWFGERTIGTLVQTPKNKHQNIVGSTMIKRHTSKTLFTHICDNLPPRYAEKIGAHTLFRTIGPKWQTILITPELSEAIRPLTTQMGIADEFKLESTSLWKHMGKSFSTPSRHIGNSRIEFNQNGTTTFGEIIHILRVESQTDPVFVIRPFSRLTPLDEMKSPYYSHPYIKARVMYHQPQPLLAITLKDLVGHSAVVENPPGTLGISLPTVYVISLRTLGIFEMSSTYKDICSQNQAGHREPDI